MDPRRLRQPETGHDGGDDAVAAGGVEAEGLARARARPRQQLLPQQRAGTVEAGPKQVVIEPLGVTFTDADLHLRA